MKSPLPFIAIALGKSKQIIAGFYKEDTHDIIPYDRCFVQDDLSNKIIKAVVAAMKENKIDVKKFTPNKNKKVEE